MRRHSVGQLSIWILALGFVWAASAQAATFNADPNASKLTFKLAGLAGIPVLHEGPGTATLTGNAMPLTADANVWSTQGFGPGTSLFTGVPLLSHLVVNIDNFAGVFGPAPSAQPIPVGTGSVATGENTGVVGVGGTAFVFFLSGAKTALPFNQTVPPPEKGAGIGGTATLMLQGAGQITNSYARWWTGSHNMTGITSNIVQLPNRVPPGEGIAFTLDPTPNEEVKTRVTGGGFITSNPNGVLSVVNSVAIAGSFSIGSMGTGTVTLVTPLRVNTNDLVGKLPGVLRQKFSFVPEPGTILLLVSGAAGLALVGRNRMRK